MKTNLQLLKGSFRSNEGSDQKHSSHKPALYTNTKKSYPKNDRKVEYLSQVREDNTA